MAEQPVLPPAGNQPASGAADRNLLFAVLAFQINFIIRQDLLAAFDSWSVSKKSSIADWLVENKKLSASQRHLIDALAAEHMNRHQHDPLQSLAALTVNPISRQVLEEIADQE